MPGDPDWGWGTKMRSKRPDKTSVKPSADRRAVLLGGLSWLSGLTSAEAGTCVEDLRTISLDGANVVRLRDYSCRAENHTGTVRFQLQRLNNTAAASLFNRTLPRRLAAVMGDPTIIENEVYKQFGTLITRFAGRVMAQGGELQLLIETPRAGTGLNETVGRVADYQISTLGEAFGTYMPQPVSVVRLVRRSEVPPGYRVIGGSTSIWRYMRASDITDFEANVRAQNLRMGRDNPLSKDMVELLQREFDLIRYVTRAGWPEDFIVVIGNLGGDGFGCESDFAFYPRELLVDVGIIENTSARPVTLSDFRGAYDRTERLRALMPRRYDSWIGADTRLDIREVTLSPGARMAIPLRLLFAGAESLGRLFERVPARDRPRQVNYIYGPEFGISSFALDGERIQLTRPSANHLALRISFGENSCPYLFVWDSRTTEWRIFGKIIEEANGREREMTTAAAFVGTALKFRLGELEPEVASIRDVRLALELRDGGSVSVAPIRVSAEREGDCWKVYYGEHIDFEFSPPEHVDRSAVVRSVVSVTGYYERYLSMQPASGEALVSSSPD